MGFAADISGDAAFFNIAATCHFNWFAHGFDDFGDGDFVVIFS